MSLAVESKIRLSAESSTRVVWFRESGGLRIYQGGLSWVVEQGLPVRPHWHGHHGLEHGVVSAFSAQPLSWFGGPSKDIRRSY